jgi:hypothetical protein
VVSYFRSTGDCLESDFTFCPFILKRAIAAATNHKQYQEQACVRYTSGSVLLRGRCFFLRVKPPLVRLDRFVAFQSKGYGAPARAPSFFATALLGTGLTPTFAAELISPLDGFQATLGPVAVSITSRFILNTKS